MERPKDIDEEFWCQIKENLSHSYPFLHLSRILGIPYADVSQAAHYCDMLSGEKPCGPNHPYYIRFRQVADSFPNSVWALIIHICGASWRWQFPPQGRGL